MYQLIFAKKLTGSWWLGNDETAIDGFVSGSFAQYYCICEDGDPTKATWFDDAMVEELPNMKCEAIN